ncbi:MAG: histidinol-phosphate transaminase [Thermomicrobiales bacterium]|nr:histidinol-phosphate transaminase [Thermomicrobiales bacterium]
MSITSYVRSAVSPAKAYKLSPRQIHEDSIFLNLNESPYSLVPKAQAVLESFKTGNRYPDFSQVELRSVIGDYVGFAPERIACGAGLDDVFQILATLFIEPGKEVIISNPTFGMYETFFPLHGAKIVDVPIGPAPDFALDVDGIIGAVNDNTAMVIVCNPNNPTGTFFPLEQIERLCENVSCPVAIDEAYAEFSAEHHLEFANKHDNAIVLRTLSKFAGLAGYRVGYGIFPEDMVPYVSAATPAFANVSGLSAAIAIACLEDLDTLKANRDEQVAERERVTSLLNEIEGVTAYPSSTNFVLFKLVDEETATSALAALAARHIYVRHYPQANLNIADHLRVSIGLPHENTAFLNALEETLANGGTS